MTDEIDIDELGDDFLKFYLDVNEVIKENENLKVEQQVTDKRLYIYNAEEKNLNEEIIKLQEMIKNFQSMLTDYNKIQEEKKCLNDNIKGLSKEKSSLEKELSLNNERFLREIQDLQTKHAHEVEKIQRQANELASSEIAVYEQKLNTELQHIESMKMTIAEKDRQKATEISRIKLEYDTKIQKLQQRQLAQANTSSGSMAARNDIFRKKLQHLQLESEKEVKKLNGTINEQQSKLVDLQHQMKIQNKQFHEQSKQQQDQVRQQDKLLRQTQTEIRRLQSQLKQEKETSIELQKTLQQQRETFESEKLMLSTSKRRKSMFNPQANYLGTPKS